MGGGGESSSGPSSFPFPGPREANVGHHVDWCLALDRTPGGCTLVLGMPLIPSDSAGDGGIGSEELVEGLTPHRPPPAPLSLGLKTLLTIPRPLPLAPFLTGQT